MKKEISEFRKFFNMCYLAKFLTTEHNFSPSYGPDWETSSKDDDEMYVLVSVCKIKPSTRKEVEMIKSKTFLKSKILFSGLDDCSYEKYFDSYRDALSEYQALEYCEPITYDFLISNGYKHIWEF